MNIDDYLSDVAVKDFYFQQPPRVGLDDASTGLGQIFARTAIRARNYCIARSIVSGVTLDTENADHLWSIWLKLHQDEDFNVRAGAEVLIHCAELVPGGPIRRPALDYAELETRQVLSRYNGTGEAAQAYGQNTLGLYKVFEKHNSAARTAA